MRARSGARPTELVGRDAEAGLVASAVHRLADGAGTAVLVEGPPGVGKTRLVEVALDVAAVTGALTGFAAGDPVGVRGPFDAAVALVGQLAGDGHPGDLDTLLEAIRRRAEPVALVPPGAARVQMTEAILAALERHARRPVVLVVEDLQWVDDASLDALRAAVPLTHHQPLLIVASARPGAPRSADAALRSEVAHLGSVLRLDELGAHDVERLAGVLLGSPPGPRLAAVLARTGGNPLEVTELLHRLATAGQLARLGAVTDLAAGVEVPAPTDTLAQRVRSAPSAVRDLLRAASILAAPFAVSDLSRLQDRPAAELAGAVEDALALGFLIEDPDGLRFAHDLVREATYDAMTPSLRAALHADAARMLAGRGEPPVAVAAHAALGAAPAEAVGWLRAAADDVMALSPERALAMLDRALAMDPDDAGVRASIQLARVESLAGVGRLEDAARLAGELDGLVAPGVLHTRLLIRQAGLLVVVNRAGEALAPLDRAVDEAPDAGLRALAQAHAALAHLAVGDGRTAGERAATALVLAEATDDRAAGALAAAVTGRTRCLTHDYRDGLGPGLDAVRRADEDPTGRAHDYVPWFWLGLIALDVDDRALLEQALSEGRARAEETFATWAQPLYSGLAAAAHHRRGELDDARAEAMTGISLAGDTGSTQALSWCEAIAALVADLAGDPAERDARLDAADATRDHLAALLGIDHLALAQSRRLPPTEAREHLGGAWDLFAALGNLNCHPVLAVPLARLAAGTDEARLAAVVEATDAAADRSQLPGLAATARHVRAIASGDPDEAARAAAQLAGLGRRLDAAEALADAARLGARNGDRRAGRFGDDATEAFEGCGAFGAARGLEAELGDTRRARAPRPRDGWDGLTPTETEVARLVGTGRTNGEIAAARGVSRRTVESHLLRIYAKLGHSSRTRLAVEAAERLDCRAGDIG